MRDLRPFSKTGPVDAKQVERLTDLVAHRGPDGRGVRVNGNVGLGHRRLAIIDLSDDGAQPMRDRSLPIWITYNGEIYNYLELRAELEALGHVFHTASDTEVLLAAYIRWGTNCLERFNGMWAFAIHDERDNSLFCARDRFGVKPFYYVNTPAQFAFGSEIRQLLPLIEGAVADDDLVGDFLVCGLTDHTAEPSSRESRSCLPDTRCASTCRRANLRSRDTIPSLLVRWRPARMTPSSN